MASRYKIRDNEGIYFISFSTVAWVDVFTRPTYKHIIVESLNYCIEHKGLEIFSWVLMSNHIHLLAKAKEGNNLSDILRDFKKYSSQMILKAIEENPQESRKNWMLWIFKKAGEKNSNNKKYQFWQQDNHPLLVDTNEKMEKAINYIHNNPVKAEITDEPQEYKYSSAKNFAGLIGEVKIEKL